MASFNQALRGLLHVLGKYQRKREAAGRGEGGGKVTRADGTMTVTVVVVVDDQVSSVVGQVGVTLPETSVINTHDLRCIRTSLLHCHGPCIHTPSSYEYILT
ncbi:hypothetical protein E2C01_035555 [Portunus trituberculatus]|uniref:Uncharacterized protein n=1 Tax=Portunus trituberculatus TaxID=210409 RepID=A0A5B7FBS7_PORTR|nr:hypothetical protein [Portunus trituberculatus]